MAGTTTVNDYGIVFGGEYPVTLRGIKGEPLTIEEMDNNIALFMAIFEGLVVSELITPPAIMGETTITVSEFAEEMKVNYENIRDRVLSPLISVGNGMVSFTKKIPQALSTEAVKLMTVSKPTHTDFVSLAYLSGNARVSTVRSGEAGPSADVENIEFGVNLYLNNGELSVKDMLVSDDQNIIVADTGDEYGVYLIVSSSDDKDYMKLIEGDTVVVIDNFDEYDELVTANFSAENLPEQS